MPKRLVIIPAFNEQGTIAQVVADVRREVPDCDIVVVDDGSTDGTASAVPREATLIQLPFNLGIGGAVQAGYRYAFGHGYDAAIQVDGDGQHPPAAIAEIFTKLDADAADMVVASRFIEGAGYAVPAGRMAGINILRGLLRLLTGQRFTDPTSGFRAVGPRLIAAFAHFYPEDYPEPETLLLCHRAGCKIVELPVAMVERTAGVSSIPFMRGLFYVLKVSVALLLGTLRRPWPPEKLRQP